MAQRPRLRLRRVHVGDKNESFHRATLCVPGPVGLPSLRLQQSVPPTGRRVVSGAEI
jgi:hypothetical protein